MQYVRCFRLYVSANSAALPMSHWRYELCITYPYYASLSGACTWEGYGLRITYPYSESSAESPPERAMDYALRIRIMYSSAESPPERAMYYESWGGVRSAACSPNNPPPLAQTLTSRCR